MSDGVLVFQRTASNSDAGNAPGRERAETKDTVDENDEVIDFNFLPETETLGRNDSAAALAAGGNRPHDEAPATPMGSNFSLSDGNEDDFVGSPAPGYNGDSIRHKGSSFMPPEEQQPPPAPADDPALSAPRREPQTVNLQSSLGVAHNMEINVVPAIIFGGMAAIFLLLLFSFFFDINKVSIVHMHRFNVASKSRSRPAPQAAAPTMPPTARNIRPTGSVREFWRRSRCCW